MLKFLTTLEIISLRIIKRNNKFNQEIQIYDRRSNEIIKRLYNKPDVTSSYIPRKRLERFGHVRRIDGQLLKNVLVTELNKTGLLGSSKNRWIDVVIKDLATINQKATL